MSAARYQLNVEIDNLLDAWEWCSRRLHVKWQRKPRLRNGVYVGLAHALLGQNSISGDTLIRSMGLPRDHEELERPLLTPQRLRIFWKLKPDALLELCYGCYTQTSPLTKPLNRLRSTYQINPVLDDLTKKMRCREKRFGSEWYTEGHHPSSEVRLLKEEIGPYRKELKKLILNQQPAIEELIEEILPQGWHFPEIPARWLVRKTPEKLLNRALRLKLWQTAQQALARDLPLDALCQALASKITPSVKSAIEAQGYTVDNVVDDMLNFDMRKARDEITS